MSQQNQPDELESFIQANREAFDHLEPSPDLWKTVVDESSVSEAAPSATPWTTYLWRAATVAALIVGTLAIWRSSPTETDQLAQADSLPALIELMTSSIPDSALPEELLEAEAFYTSQLQAMKVELALYSKTYPDLQEEATFDLAELDSAYADLKQDLKDDLANEEVVSALIQNYRLKLQVLETILEQIKKIENSPQKDEDNNLSYM
ncbi:MAG: hypothetical protein ACFB10_03015 [Salibacteraceae bacterium]